MIQSISLQNFQSHDSSLLEFDPGVNVIVGNSDSGKTAVLRALNWVLTNRPTGEAFRRYGTDITRVTIIVDEGQTDGTITRSRSDRENLYYGTHSGKLAAIGTSVPESVLKLLRMDPDVNIQRQLDAPFLLSCSAGEVAQRLNAVVGLDEIDVGLSNVARRVKQNHTAFEATKKQCEQLSEQVDSFSYLEQMEEEIASLESQFGQLSMTMSLADGLEQLSDAIAADQDALRNLPNMDHALAQIWLCEGYLQNYNKEKASRELLSACLNETVQTSASIDELPDVSLMITKVEEVEESLGQLSQTELLLRSVGDLLRQQITVQDDLRVISEEIKKHEEQFHKDMPVICPLCGRKGK